MSRWITSPWGDIFGIIITLGYVFALLKISKIVSEIYSVNTGRKVLHVGIGCGIWVWFLYNTTLGALIPPLIATITIGIAPENIQNKFSTKNRLHDQLTLYCASVAILTGIFWEYPPGNPVWIGASAFLTLAWGDGLGGSIGKKFGTHNYEFPWGRQKSIEGSIGVSFGTFCAILIAQIFFSGYWPPRVLPLLVGSIVAPILEGVAPKYTDNVLVPLGLALILALFFL